MKVAVSGKDGAYDCVHHGVGQKQLTKHLYHMLPVTQTILIIITII